ncbi:oxidoreductase [Nocardioides sp. cx-169]|uniref:WD40/YVTN/BNR-like repeat-containing protein n=1 Tax=Nocardioides sp. cx-169 TaxID=2899080 RepID=UPI001E6016FF|nr:oxidoreductase [Nocardioides sp. cx-169]MCD4532491.1 oxidoreductase [Nocardioides sp. cx-169]
MARLGALVLSTVLIGSALAGPSYAGGGGAPGHHGPPGAGRGDAASWDERVIDAEQSFRGLDAVDRRVAWVAGGSATEGAPGRVFRTTDGGRSWDDVSPPDTEGLLFRDVEARSAKEAVVLAIGAGDASRIYRTIDGGRSWAAAFVNDDPAAFYDCMAFYPGGRRGLAMSDPVDGRFRILATRDSGRSWTVLPDGGMPEAPTEFGFAASGDCLVTAGRTAYFGSGGGVSRVFRSDDFGRTWTATDSTIPAGESAGVFALTFRTPNEGVAVGGDFAAPADGVDAVAVTRHGRAWRNAGDPRHLGEDVAYLPGRGQRLIVTGESGEVRGTSVSRDGGRSWRQVSGTGYHALDCTRDGSCWAAGGGGRVARLVPRR